MSLNIIVLAKQVPDTRNVGPDAMTPEGTVNRSALPAIFNPEDLNALEQALRLKDANPGSTVTVITMGPPRAAEVIRESLYRGADGGYLLTDRAFAGADTLATSYALAATIQKLGMPDVILGGRQAIDGDTAQVGPQVAQKLGLPTVPVLVREMTDDEAVILMVDSNLQRENLLPSEKAFAYKMKLEAMKHQGKSTSVQLAPKLTTEQIGYEAGISKDVVKRYIRLTNLVPPLLQMVDDGRIAFSPAVELSYLTRDEQAELWDLIGREDATPSLSQALRIKQLSRAAKLTPEVLYAILTEEKPNQKEQIRIKTESLRKYFPRNYSAQQMEREIIKLLEARYRAKDRGER